MNSTPRRTLILTTVAAALAVASCAPLSRAAEAEPFASAWPTSVTRPWIGPEYWSNPLQDWQISDGRLECITSGGDRNVHLLTRQLGEAKGTLLMRVRLGALEKPSDLTPGWAGFRIGIIGFWKEYRDSLLRGKGLDAGVTTDGHLFIGAPPKAEKGKAAGKVPLEEVELRLSAEPAGDGYRLKISAHDPKTGEAIAETSRQAKPDQLVGNVALVCSANTKGQARGGKVRFWFRDWRVEGSKVEAHPEHAFGPILFAQYTLSRGVMKMTAQMPPLGEGEPKTVRLETRDGGAWKEIARADIDPMARTAAFRIANWDASRDVPYRLVYAMVEADGKPRDHTFEGTVRRDPVDKDPLVVAAFTGNADYGWPNLELVEHVKAQKPDFLFFSGDNIYEQVGGYGIQRGPVPEATLDYLRKWYFFGWAYVDLMRDRPAVSIPDDHDVYQGNVWGAGGRHTEKDDKGGYVMDSTWVNMVHRTQTSHLPDPYDAAPIDQGITVYYTDVVYGRVSFAVIADRMFKSGPSGLVPPTTSGRDDHVADPNFDPKTADVPGAVLLGDRQLKFLDDWAGDWAGTDLKCVLSQTIFCNGATHHGGNLAYLVADYDSNGWPQTGRNKALAAMRKGFALHVAGDQHLATLIHHGVDDWDDAAWSFAVPSVANLYLRAWKPKKPGQPIQPGMPKFTGRYLDPFDNRISVWAITNPGPMGVEPASLYDKKPGHGIVRCNKAQQSYTIECWPRFADPRDPKAVQYEGWPKTVPLESNYGRKPAAYLPELVVEGMAGPVVTVREAGGDLVYARRIRGTTYRPPVFDASAAYTIEVGEPGTDKMWTLKNVKPVAEGEAKTLRVTF